MRSHALPILLLTLASLTAPVPSAAAIFKCVDAAGAVTYTGRPCAEQDLTERAIDTPIRRGSASRRGSGGYRGSFAPAPGVAARDDEDRVGERPPPGAPAAAEPLPERERPTPAQP